MTDSLIITQFIIKISPEMTYYILLLIQFQVNDGLDGAPNSLGKVWSSRRREQKRVRKAMATYNTIPACSINY